MFEPLLATSRTFLRLQRIAAQTGNTVTVTTDGYKASWSLNGNPMKDAETVRHTMKPPKEKK